MFVGYAIGDFRVLKIYATKLIKHFCFFDKQIVTKDFKTDFIQVSNHLISYLIALPLCLSSLPL